VFNIGRELALLLELDLLIGRHECPVILVGIGIILDVLLGFGLE
jgi:hypothetical protein